MAGVARLLLSWWTGEKRAQLELELDRTGHRWPARYVMGLARCGGECGARILAWLDGRDDPHGTLTEEDLDEAESVAGWAGTPGALWATLKRAQLIDVDAEGNALRWHDFDALNGATIRRRLARRSGGAGATDDTAPRDTPRDTYRDKHRDTARDRDRDTPLSVSGSGSEKREISLNPGLSPRAREPGGGAAPAPPQRSSVEEAGAEARRGQTSACPRPSPRGRDSPEWSGAVLLLERLGARQDQIDSLRGTAASDAEIYRACRDCLDQAQVERLRNAVGWIWRSLYPGRRPPAKVGEEAGAS